ncbi:hypothetical protein [Deinococcus sp.]|uniref:hypothetical protein n=1 Tax=Deinococcus sp. TaxID=47478 RepID=UPI003B5AEF7A
MSKDPEHLMPKINIPIKDETTLTYKQTFLGRIHESGGMVDIAKLDSQAIRNQLGIHWAGQHNGQPEGVEWQDRIQGQK